MEEKLYFLFPEGWLPPKQISLAPLKMERDPLRLSREVVCCAFSAPQRVFSWGDADVSPYQTVSDSQQTQSGHHYSTASDS